MRRTGFDELREAIKAGLQKWDRDVAAGHYPRKLECDRATVVAIVVAERVRVSRRLSEREGR